MRGLAIAACAAAALAHAQPDARPQPPRSGIEFAGADARAMQADDFANPAMLWVARGEALWREKPAPAARSCADCHGDAAAAMKGVAARYPRIDAATGRLVNLEARVNLCRTGKQGASAWEPESAPLLGLAAYIGRQSRGMPIAFSPDPRLAAHRQRGAELYRQRMGQMNLACTHCHDRNWGKRLLAETISQGHPNAYPAYRMSWETLGSLARRLRACFFGIRAEMPPYGSPDLLDLEVYLAWRAQGLGVETPGVRR